MFGQRQIYQGQNNVKRTFVPADCGGGQIYQGQITLHCVSMEEDWYNRNTANIPGSQINQGYITQGILY